MKGDVHWGTTRTHENRWSGDTIWPSDYTQFVSDGFTASANVYPAKGESSRPCSYHNHL